MKHLLMIVYMMKRTGKEKHSILLYLVATLTLVIFRYVLPIFMYYHCKKRSARMSLMLTKTMVKQ